MTKSKKLQLNRASVVRRLNRLLEPLDLKLIRHKKVLTDDILGEQPGRSYNLASTGGFRDGDYILLIAENVNVDELARLEVAYSTRWDQ